MHFRYIFTNQHVKSTGSETLHDWRAAVLAFSTSDSRSSLRRAGKNAIHNTPTKIVPTPPSTTEGTVPNQAAVKPDSNSPSSLDAPIKREFTALTRPRIASGVANWTKVDLT